MKNVLQIVQKPVGPRCAAVVLLLALAGCGQGSEIKMQRVPKDSSDSAPVAPTATAPDMSMPAVPHGDFHGSMGAAPAQPIKWTLPAGWTEKPLGQMRVGSFNAPGKNGQATDVSVIPLASSGPQMELANLNMWRGELMLPPTDRDESTAIPIGPREGKLFDLNGGQPAMRILVATLDRDGTTWYFKLKGEDSVVRDVMPSFLAFLKSVSFDAGEAPATTAASNPHSFMGAPGSAPAETAAAAAASDKPASWTIPAGWQELPATQFLVAKYRISGDAAAPADINISMLAGEGGGILPNLNRWRNQLGLPPVTQEEEWSKLAQSLDLPDGPGTIVDMTSPGQPGQQTRLVGIIVPKSGQTWFYKLMGPEALVGRQKDAFVTFVRSAKYAN